jgi:3-hydroxyisobutyrate dehydrogenase-like beta-hydroxyacid dehydrogenase
MPEPAESSLPPLRAGVVGIGTIGGGVAVSLARRGRTPVVYDIRPEAAEQLDGVPGLAGSSAEVARQADVVFVAVVDADQARQVVSGEHGLLEGAHPGLIIVLLSTVSVPVVHELAQLARKHAVDFIDCGVTPGNLAATNGMVAIVGGDDQVVRRAMPVLEDFAKRVVYCGQLGAGMATKIARNVITYGSWRAVFEATQLAERSGVEVSKLAEVIEASDPEGATLLLMLHLRGTSGPAEDVELASHLRHVDVLMDKDLAAAEGLAEQLALSVPVINITRARGLETLGLPGRAGS